MAALGQISLGVASQDIRGKWIKKANGKMAREQGSHRARI